MRSENGGSSDQKSQRERSSFKAFRGRSYRCGAWITRMKISDSDDRITIDSFQRQAFHLVFLGPV